MASLARLVLSVAECRRIDQRAIDDLGFPSIVLMENAGRGAAEALLRFDPSLRAKRPVGIVCGKGNNAADGLVVARRLAIAGVPATVALVCNPRDLSGDAATNYRIAQAVGTVCHDLSAIPADDPTALTAALDRTLAGSVWLVDALVGTGAVGALRAPLSTAATWMNAQRAQLMAIDVPSGLNADTGEATQPTVRADLTCTFAAMKQGFLEPGAQRYLGEVRVIDIGVPASALRAPVG